MSYSLLHHRKLAPPGFTPTSTAQRSWQRMTLLRVRNQAVPLHFRWPKIHDQLNTYFSQR